MQLSLTLPSTPSSSTNFPYHCLQGDWSIVASSLPLWKGRKDVMINYQVSTANSKGKGKQLAIKDEMWWNELEINQSLNSTQTNVGLDQLDQQFNLNVSQNHQQSKNGVRSDCDVNCNPNQNAASTSASSRPKYQTRMASKSSKMEKSFASRVISSSISKGSNKATLSGESSSSSSSRDKKDQSQSNNQTRSNKSLIRGVSKIDPKGQNRTSFLWRGAGILYPITSNWQIIGVDSEEKDGSDKKEFRFLITYFQKTLFTPSGIDIYARTPTSLSRQEICEIIQEMKDFDSISIQSLEFKSESKEPIDPINRKEISKLNQSDVSISKSASDFLHTDPYQGSDPAHGGIKRSSSTNNVGSSSSSKPSTIWNCFSNSQSKHNDNGDSSDDEKDLKDGNHPANLKKSRSFISLKRKKSNLNHGKEKNHSEKPMEDGSAKEEFNSSSKDKSKRKEAEEIRSKISELRSLGASTFLVPHSSNPDSFVEL